MRVEQAVEALLGAEVERDDRGVVWIQTSQGLCSATALSRRWLLAGLDCFCGSDLADPTTIMIQAGDRVSYAHRAIESAEHNAVLLRSRYLMPLAEEVALFEGSATDLVGEEIECMGFGAVAAGDDGGAAVEPTLRRARFAVLEAGAGLGASSPGCTYPRSIDGFRAQSIEAEAPAIGAGDSGGGCFADVAGRRTLVGIVGAASPEAPEQALLVGIDAVRDFIFEHSDLFSADECARDVPGSDFGLDPLIAPGAPDGTYLSLVALDPYAFDEDSQGGGVMLWQTNDALLRSWTRVDASELGPVHSVHAAAKFVFSPVQELPLDINLSDPDGRVSFVDWTASAGFAEPRVVPAVDAPAGSASAIGISLTIEPDGALLYPIPQDPTGFVLDRLPFEHAPADPLVRATTVSNPFSGGLGFFGYRGLDGRYHLQSGSWACVDASGGLTYFCDDNRVIDFPDEPLHLSLGMKLGEGLYAITADAEGRMELYLMTDAAPRSLGPIAGRAIGRPSLVEYRDELWVAYTTEQFRIRVKPAGGCLGR
ncbi:MAG: hypothetical protein OEZ06_26950 [Myxococcales bacterium]|nr:hypothetical protein [Myxococcales bacterium]